MTIALLIVYHSDNANDVHNQQSNFEEVGDEDRLEAPDFQSGKQGAHNDRGSRNHLSERIVDSLE